LGLSPSTERIRPNLFNIRGQVTCADVLFGRIAGGYSALKTATARFSKTLASTNKPHGDLTRKNIRRIVTAVKTLNLSDSLWSVVTFDMPDYTVDMN
jgi:hypothetical protein